MKRVSKYGYTLAELEFLQAEYRAAKAEQAQSQAAVKAAVAKKREAATFEEWAAIILHARAEYEAALAKSIKSGKPFMNLWTKNTK